MRMTINLADFTKEAQQAYAAEYPRARRALAKAEKERAIEEAKRQAKRDAQRAHALRQTFQRTEAGEQA